MEKTEKKQKDDKLLKLEAEMGRYYNQMDACQSTIQQIRPKLNAVILKIQELKKKEK